MSAPQSPLNRILGGIGVIGSYSVIALLLVAVLMIILPLPPLVVDVLIGVNIGLTALVLMLALNITRAVEFATLPSVILVVTVFRMSIEITTSRSILVEADAGEIVRAFGEYVIGGNLLAGVVIFMIITVVQFLVITKGSERVAEVGARFTLDAMPGKQLAIDNDLRNGDITQAEATRLRRLLAQENQLFGAMDGAMKFVKGDALAGMAIVTINLVGGIVIGVLQHDLSLSAAAHTFSLLTVGAGLIAQVPALFMSIASGAIITRVTGGDTSLGIEISREFARPRPLATAAGILAAMALVPHFPKAIFAGLAAVMAGLAWLAHRQQKPPPEPETVFGPPVAVTAGWPGGGAKADGKAGGSRTIAPAELRLGAALVPAATDMTARLGQLGRHLQEEFGIDFPVLRVSADAGLPEQGYCILIDHLPVARGELPAGRVLVRAAGMDVDLLGIDHLLHPVPPAGNELWADASATERLDRAGLPWLGMADVLVERMAATLRRNAGQFMGIQEAKNLLAAMESDGFEDLVRESNRVVPLQRFTDVLKRLLDEQISVRNRRLILEALVEWGPKEQDPALLAEYVRGSLKRQISHAHADSDKMIAAILLQRDTEDVLRAALRPTAVGTYLTLADADSARLLEQVRRKRPSEAPAPPVVLLTSLDIRRFLRSFLTRNEIDMPVLSFQDIAPDYAVRPITTLSLAGDPAGPSRTVSPPSAAMATP